MLFLCTPTIQTPLYRIFIPIIIFGIVTFCCASFCKIFYRTREERQQRLAAENRARDVSSSVYVIPISLTDDDVHRPPRYSTVQLYDPPPAYNQVTPHASRLYRFLFLSLILLLTKINYLFNIKLIHI